MARPRRPYIAIRQREGRSGMGEEVPLLYLSILVGRGGTIPLKRGIDIGLRGRMRWSSGGNTRLRCKRGVDNYFVYTMIFNIGPLEQIEPSMGRSIILQRRSGRKASIPT